MINFLLQAEYADNNFRLTQHLTPNESKHIWKEAGFNPWALAQPMVYHVFRDWRGAHSTEVAFGLLAQRPLVQILALLRFFQPCRHIFSSAGFVDRREIET